MHLGHLLRKEGDEVGNLPMCIKQRPATCPLPLGHPIAHLLDILLKQWVDGLQVIHFQVAQCAPPVFCHLHSRTCAQRTTLRYTNSKLSLQLILMHLSHTELQKKQDPIACGIPNTFNRVRGRAPAGWDV
eukprot:970523-Pelagomonas_calceolata.AAC.2